jgi:two-component system, OmpR family, alkaline phosphatase synthesis response regulator PhoP
MSQRILIVEDDRSILRGLELNLQLEGYQTVTAHDGGEALDCFGSERVDLVILDVMMPHVNGFEVVQTLREQGSDVPVIMLSAKSAQMDIVRGLDLGADDYVTKPFKLAELLARVNAHLRRRGPPETTFTFADIVVDLEQRVVTKQGKVVGMTAKEFDLLKLLVERTGRALTRELILDSVWGYGYFGTDRTVDNFIQRLRNKLDASAHIRTVRGVGYRFVVDATR